MFHVFFELKGARVFIIFSEIRIESFFFTAKSAKVAKIMLSQLCILCVLCGELLHKLYILTAMGELSNPRARRPHRRTPAFSSFLFRRRYTHLLRSWVPATPARRVGHADLRRFELGRGSDLWIGAQAIYLKSARGADIMDGMNRMDRMLQNNI